MSAHGYPLKVTSKYKCINFSTSNFGASQRDRERTPKFATAVHYQFFKY